MADLPILFSAPMVRAIIAGRKTQTRRVIKRLRGVGTITEFGSSNTQGYAWHFRDKGMRWHDLRHDELMGCLSHQVGDRLWVREAHAFVGSVDPGWLLYRADGYEHECARHGFDRPFPPETEVDWRPSIHMPRIASRLTLCVTKVRVQHLQDISNADAVSEGVEPFGDGTAFVRLQDAQTYSTTRECFAALWNSINGPVAFRANPWVAAYTFDVHLCNIDHMEDGDHG